MLPFENLPTLLESPTSVTYRTKKSTTALVRPPKLDQFPVTIYQLCVKSERPPRGTDQMERTTLQTESGPQASQSGPPSTSTGNLSVTFQNLDWYGCQLSACAFDLEDAFKLLINCCMYDANRTRLIRVAGRVVHLRSALQPQDHACPSRKSVQTHCCRPWAARPL